jgi:polysaccharide export outer membrane protein
MVTIVRNVANSVIVNGDVRKSGRYELSLKGDRVLDLVAAAGGAATPARETMVSLIRNGRKGIQSLKRIIDNPSENIFVCPGDQIYLSHNPQTFTAFGAVSKKGEYPFDSDRVSLLEAVARAGGLLDNRANAGGVFLFRYERNQVLRAAGKDPAELHPSGLTPTIYVLDMRKPRAFFLAQAFMMRDNDVIYVANSVSTELTKFLRLLNLGTATLRGTMSTVNVVSE